MSGRADVDAAAASADYFRERGQLHYGRAEFANADEMFTRAIELDPGNHLNFSARSSARLALGRASDFKAALADAEKCLSILPDWPEGLYKQALALRSLGRFSKAQEILEKARDLLARATADGGGASGGAGGDSADAAAHSSKEDELDLAEVDAKLELDAYSLGLSPAALREREEGRARAALRASVAIALEENAKMWHSEGEAPEGAAEAEAAASAAAAAADGSSSSAVEVDKFEALERWLLGKDGAVPPSSTSALAAASAAAATAAAAAAATAGGAGTAAASGAASLAAGYTSAPRCSVRAGCSFPLLYMRKYDENNRGVHCRADVAGDREIMRIGQEYLITVEIARSSALGRKVAAARIDHELSAAKHCYLALFVLWDRRNPESFYQPYYRILPQSYPNMPIFWTPEELSWLRGSYLLTQIEERKAHIRADYELLCSVAPEVGEVCSLSEFSWARMMVASRNFGIIIEGVRTDALVPYADMLNHHRPRQTRWAYDNYKRSFVIISMHGLHAGQQVYDSYGKKCNSRFLLNYGFTVEYNTDDDIGQNHNEVRLLIALRPAEEDPWHTRKLELLDGSSATRSVRISMYYENDATQETFSFLRFVNAKNYELMYVPRVDADFDLARKPIAPLSCDNESAVLSQLAKLCAAQLAAYPTSLADDLEALRSGRHAYYSNRRNAIVLVKGEKEVCQHYVALARDAIPLLAMQPREAAAVIAQSYQGGSDTDKYMRNVVLPLVRRKAV